MHKLSQTLNINLLFNFVCKKMPKPAEDIKIRKLSTKTFYFSTLNEN